MVTGTVLISIESGLHARPASHFISFASNYEASVLITKADRSANAKSILGLLSLGLKKGDEVTLTVNGKNENIAFSSISEYLSGMTD